MNARSIIAVSVMLFFAAIIPLLAYDMGWPPGAEENFRQRLQDLGEARPAQPANQNMEASNADISAGLKKYIDSSTRKSTDRRFHIRYRGKDLALDLVKVHDDRIPTLGSGKCFACVDMKGADGRIYDIDFFMALRPGKLTVTEMSVHKINGKPFYNWKQAGGVWKKVKIS